MHSNETLKFKKYAYFKYEIIKPWNCECNQKKKSLILKTNFEYLNIICCFDTFLIQIKFVFVLQVFLISFNEWQLYISSGRWFFQCQSCPSFFNENYELMYIALNLQHCTLSTSNWMCFYSWQYTLTKTTYLFLCEHLIIKKLIYVSLSSKFMGKKSLNIKIKKTYHDKENFHGN